jgi:hypothetical protein
VSYVKSTSAIHWLHSLEGEVPLSNGSKSHPRKDASYWQERSELCATTYLIVLLRESENVGLGRILANVEIEHIEDR